MLYPRESETRQVVDVSGLWNFRLDPDDLGLSEKWFQGGLKSAAPMPVPASYNDITVDAAVRDHIGPVWYEKEFFIPASWRQDHVQLRFGAAAHNAIVYCNGEEIGRHEGGFLPFVVDCGETARFGEANRVTVRIDNRLTWQSLPPGEIIDVPDNDLDTTYRKQDIHFDFFNYSGLHRPVHLIRLPRTRIDSIAVHTGFERTVGSIEYTIGLCGPVDGMRLEIVLEDAEGREVTRCTGASGTLEIQKVRLWAPGKPYLYRLVCSLYAADGSLVDRYRQPAGVRTVEVTDTRFLINGEPFYFKGFGKHEDADLRGRGLDLVTVMRDFHLMEWIGANSFRTSHYPYAEEVLNLADELGVVVIDEAPAVGQNAWGKGVEAFCDERINDDALSNHLRVMEELIARDRNHPSVVMWSVGNEPASDEPGAEDYFRRVVEHTRALDPYRPLTIVECSRPEKTRVSQFVDVLCLNRYPGWYFHYGKTDIIAPILVSELTQWHERYNKPIIITEMGADTIAGFHQLPPTMFSEEFQTEFLLKTCESFDQLPFVAGEHVWNFADFGTKQGVTRVGGNKKGVFTRQRQPKAAAFMLRTRWRS
jgi:beta-glucuronidase